MIVECHNNVLRQTFFGMNLSPCNLFRRQLQSASIESHSNQVYKGCFRARLTTLVKLERVGTVTQQPNPKLYWNELDSNLKT
jgi:hypothetical protein